MPLEGAPNTETKAQRSCVSYLRPHSAWDSLCLPLRMLSEEAGRKRWECGVSFGNETGFKYCLWDLEQNSSHPGLGLPTLAAS
jgi:hypothetical protein